MKRRDFFGLIAASPVAAIAAVVPEYSISIRPQVKIRGGDRKQIICECSVRLFANGEEIAGRDLEMIGRQARLGLCRVKELAVESAA